MSTDPSATVPYFVDLIDQHGAEWKQHTFHRSFSVTADTTKDQLLKVLLFLFKTEELSNEWLSDTIKNFRAAGRNYDEFDVIEKSLNWELRRRSILRGWAKKI